MNAIDYFFENSKKSNKLFLLNKREQISYNSLYTKTCQLALYLNKSFGTKQNILLLSTNNLFFIISYLGIIKSGNVCIPVNPAISESTLSFIIEETQPKLALIQSRFIENIKNKKFQIVTELLMDAEVKKYEADFNKEYIDLSDKNQIAEIIYTSGSTALPKGVMISHKNLIANTSSIVEYLKLKDNDIIMVVLPFYYCYGLSLLHTHLRVGGSIVLNNTFMLLGSVINDLKNYKCTGFAGVPSHFQILLRKTTSFKATSFDHLRYVTQAGGKLHNVFIEEFIEYFPNISFYVMYGQTEATARLSYLPPKNLKRKMGSIGVGIPGVELKVVDADGKEVKPNEIGEIAAKGDNIMTGYYKAEDLTSKTIKNGYLQTGDLAKMDEDGYFYLVARKKEIIKVGGERISPKEIEEVIVRIPEVIDCTIEGVYDEILGEKIKAIIVINKDTNIELLEYRILQECKSSLSSIKVPQLIQFENQVDVNSSGKKVKKTN
jgi:acyl-CoA synthetase (AMP-forming)/AMP-acid ligase II